MVPRRDHLQRRDTVNAAFAQNVAPLAGEGKVLVSPPQGLTCSVVTPSTRLAATSVTSDEGCWPLVPVADAKAASGQTPSGGE